MTKPLRLQLKIRNNRLIEDRETLGLGTKEAAKALGIHYSGYIVYESAAVSPLTKRGRWKKTALRIAKFYGRPPEYLWPDEVLKLKQNTFERKVSFQDLLPAQTDPNLKLDVASAIRKLPAREALAIQGLMQGDTYEETGGQLKVSRERARQIQMRAVEMLKREHLRDYDYD